MSGEYHLEDICERIGNAGKEYIDGGPCPGCVEFDRLAAAIGRVLALADALDRNASRAKRGDGMSQAWAAAISPIAELIHDAVRGDPGSPTPTGDSSTERVATLAGEAPVGVEDLRETKSEEPWIRP